MLSTLMPVDSECFDLPISNEFVVTALVASVKRITDVCFEGLFIEMSMGSDVFWRVSSGGLPIGEEELGGLPADNAVGGSLAIESDSTALKLLNFQHTGEV